MRNLISLFAGLLFGAGLIVSDMVNPVRVRSFLDIFGNWDPSLAFVMISAIGVTAIAWRIANRRRTAIFGGAFPAMPAEKIDRKLVGGSALFGIGWGAVGICPAPGIVALGLGVWQVGVFLIAMFAAMYIYHLWQTRARTFDATGNLT